MKKIILQNKIISPHIVAVAPMEHSNIVPCPMEHSNIVAEASMEHNNIVAEAPMEQLFSNENIEALHSCIEVPCIIILPILVKTKSWGYNNLSNMIREQINTNGIIFLDNITKNKYDISTTISSADLSEILLLFKPYKINYLLALQLTKKQIDITIEE